MLTFSRQKDCSINKLRAVRKRAATLLLLLSASITTTIRAQQPIGTDYSGIYYFVNCGSGKSGDPKIADLTSIDDYFYLVPADDPHQTNKRDAWFSSDYDTSNGDSEQPYLTTYKTKKDAATVPANVTNRPHNSVWIVKFAGTDSGTDYYYLIHVATGKYIVYEPPYPNYWNRKSVHLLTTDNPDDDAQFAINVHTNNYNFRPKSVGTGKNDNKYLNAAHQNFINYYSSDKTSDGDADYFRGLLGLWKDAGDNSDWKPISTLLPAPTINYNIYNDNFTITYDQLPSGFDILYSTDGNAPTIGGSNTLVYTDVVTVTGSYTVKAVVACYGMVLTEVASQAVGIPPTPVITLPSDCGNRVIMDADGIDIYYTLDGTTPDNTSTLYTGPVAINQDVTITAIAYNGSQYSPSLATQAYTPPYTPQPVISNTGNTVTITAVAGATILYTLNGGQEQTYTDPFTVTPGYDHQITATAQISGKLASCEVSHIVKAPIEITTLAQLKSMEMAKQYYLGADIDADGTFTSIGTTDAPFTGTLNGNGHSVNGLQVPLFGTVSGAVIHDINLKDVSISSSETAVGAIACVAKGYTRIYNCGILPNTAAYPDGTHPSVSTTGTYAGSIVGSLEDDSRVVNCFSYADVSAVTAAGIVGNNAYVSSTSNGVSYGSTAKENGGKYTQLRTMVVNCMFYGNITATNIYPVYGGAKINNKGNNAINNYNFYRNDGTFTGTLKDYNCSWPAQEDFLTRHEYYRNLLNSNRELCGWWVGAPSAPNTMNAADVQAVPKDASLIAKWVLDPAIAPYPILKPFGKYTSAVNIDADAEWRATAKEWEGKKLGTLNVTINPGGHAAAGVTQTSEDFVITDMDTLRGDYCYRKIQLPYYNTVFGNPDGSTWETKYGGNYGEYVVVGWEITNTDGAAGTYTADWQTGYNFADRNGSDKDKYSVSGRIFAQGGYYYVPYDVEEITITAHWAKAIYLNNTDNSYDRVNMSGSNAGTHFAPAGTRPSLGNGRTVNTGTINSLIPSGGRVYEDAIVLVGNYQYRNGAGDIKGALNTDGITIMSADLDFDDEPDYCLLWQLGNKTTRQNICPIRFDFLPVIELGLAMKEDGSKVYYSFGCYHPLGHFEVTETSLIHFGQFEFGGTTLASAAPIILNGGIFDQYTKGTTNVGNAGNDKISYVILGGNVSMPSFTPGAHVSSTQGVHSTRHCAVTILGGYIDNIYLTGNYNEGITPNKDNPHCYIDGGRIKHVAAAGKEGIDGNVFFEINHSKIWEFYGGSTLATQQVTGNISVTINNSIVEKYCGGPKFGDMAAGKTITTNATNTVFRVYYGGGNGGTCYVQYESGDGAYTISSFNWSTLKVDNYSPGTYRSAANNYMANYDMVIVRESTGTSPGDAVFRTFFYAAQFSATNTGSITNNLTDCTVLTNFYGAGNLGGVNGNVTSTLTDTHVKGSAFGAGFSATIPDVTIYNKDKTAPTIDVYSSTITPESGGTSTTYTWTNETSLGGQELSTANPAVTGVTIGNETKNYFYTNVPLNNLGAVSGAVRLTITGTDDKGSVIGTDNDPTTGHVYGGGDASSVFSADANATASTSVTIKGRTTVLGDVFGGGNRGDVGGNVTVNIESGTINKDVYGGGALANTNIKNVTANYGTDHETITSTDTYKTEVYLTGGKVMGDVYGGGLGEAASQENANGIEAKVYGDVAVYQWGTILVPAYTTDSLATSGRIFGCNNINGTPKGHVLVSVSNTVPANANDKYALSAVYGGGNMAAYIPAKIAQDDSENTEVVIDGCQVVTIHSVYGGGNAASTPATHVRIVGAKEIGYVYGGGNGAGQINGHDNPGANVGYKAYPESVAGPDQIEEREEYKYGSGVATTEVSGGKINYIYGGSNTKGNVRYTTIAQLEEVGNCELVVGGIYGGGREAYMEGNARIELGCMTGMEEIYGGSEKADVGNDIELTITSGTFKNIFGGNNKGGRIFGSITVNIEQTGCLPINIENLYLGGNNAPYSVYGYADSAYTVILDGESITHYKLNQSAESKYNDPVLNIRSFHTIGTVYGGGNGEHATMVGNPTVDINITHGWVNGEYTGTSDYSGSPQMLEDDGVIGTVFGGGNEAEVIGNTTILIGDKLGTSVNLKSMNTLKNELDADEDHIITEHGITTTQTSYGVTYTNETNPAKTLNVTNYQTVNGANITGNVYGGGNQANVTGNTNIQLGPNQ